MRFSKLLRSLGRGSDATRQSWALPPLSPSVYAVASLACVLYVALEYYGSMQSQLLLSAARAGAPSNAEHWSAPLDDVFIHFDFARAAARGYPFQWSEGNGYSSGGTSLLYPLVLSIGYRVGFTGLSLMHWAATVACVSVWATLLAARRFLPNPSSYSALLLPLSLLSVGALNWSLFSGMEVALFLSVWSLCAYRWVKLRADDDGALRANAWALGLSNALLVATRPEAAVLVMLFCLSALPRVWRAPCTSGRQRWFRMATVLAVCALPGAVVVIGHAVANEIFTGETSAAGAIVKLEMNHPYLDAKAVWDAWKFHYWYQFARVTNYHFSDRFWHVNETIVVSTGWVVWLVATFGLLTKRTRTMSLMLWGTQLSFMAIIALNGQVRWQNERYTMPAVAWLLLNAALGLAVCVAAVQAQRRKSSRPFGLGALKAYLPAAAALALVGLFVWGQRGPAQGQRWFFGRASRNILDQHIAVGRALRKVNPMPTRVLLSDAGAIPYASDLPAIDIIGLGGIAGLPFARASNLGVGAVVELIQRIPVRERPDIMALYPSWWRELPLWFGTPLFEAAVRGNVICGARSKVVYRPDWAPLAASDRPLATRRRKVHTIDVGDVVSERAAQFQVERAPGFVVMKILGHAGRPSEQLFDAGRVVPPGASAQFQIGGLRPFSPAQLVVRTAPVQPATLSVKVNGQSEPNVELVPADSWTEQIVDLSPASIGESTVFELEPTSGEITLYQLWVMQ